MLYFKVRKAIIFGKLMEGFISRQNNKTENKE
jgi:hypothetical protein